MHMPALVVTAAKDDTFLTVSVDQELGAALAVRHLIDLGHRRIAHVAGPLDWLDAWARHRAWQTEVKAAGLDELDVVVGDWTAGFGYEVAHVAGRLPDCTAIFAANDQMALGLIHGFAERGIRVPDDVSIVGFDDLPEAKHFLPPLTTVRQDFRALGERAVEVLHAALEGSELDRRSIIAPLLIVRESTGRPRRRDERLRTASNDRASNALDRSNVIGHIGECDRSHRRSPACGDAGTLRGDTDGGTPHDHS